MLDMFEGSCSCFGQDKERLLLITVFTAFVWGARQDVVVVSPLLFILRQCGNFLIHVPR
eukprot:m.184635 g.184635  ORF g.184635 m.184635 type:complete len:59 (-) comp16673_c0_seq1:145-321(-)